MLSPYFCTRRVTCNWFVVSKGTVQLISYEVVIELASYLTHNRNQLLMELSAYHMRGFAIILGCIANTCASTVVSISNLTMKLWDHFRNEAGLFLSKICLSKLNLFTWYNAMNQHNIETRLSISFSCNHMMYFVHTLQRQRVKYVVATCYVLYSNFTDWSASLKC